MRKISVQINVVDTKFSNDIDYDTIGPIRTYKNSIFALKDLEQKELVSKYKIRNIVSCSFTENSDNLTQTGNFVLPAKGVKIIRNETVNGVFTKGYLLFKNDAKRLYQGQQVIIDLGYDSYYQTRFIGYVANFESTDNNTITVSVEDSMYQLKRTIQMKKNFPKLIGTESFNLYHLNQWILQTLYDNKLYMPKIRCFSTVLGKIVMKDAVTPAEILQYFYKDVFNMKAYFRNEWIAPIRESDNFGDKYLMEPVLYVGWSNWDLQEYVEFEIDNKEIIAKTKLFTNKEISTNKRLYSNTHKFMYPYEVIYPNTEQYNPIIDNKLNWTNTEKENLKITATSFVAGTTNKNVVVYQDGEYFITDAVKTAKEKELAKKAKASKVTDSGTVITDTNNLGTYNEISLNYPDLTVDELKTKVTEYLSTYADSGLEGSFTVFGLPYVRQGDIVDLRIKFDNIGDENTYKTDKYYVKEVTTKMDSSSGLIQILTINKKVI